MLTNYPEKKITIVGGGIIGALEAFFAYKDAEKRGEKIRVTIHEKNSSLSETTTFNISPSLTPDEILSVVPRGEELLRTLGILFSDPEGIRVDDVDGINDSKQARAFIRAATEYSKNEEAHNLRTRILLELGKKSMDLWQFIYDEADESLKAIFEAANFNPCREPLSSEPKLHDGYRIDLIYNIYNIPDAASRAKGMRDTYQELGYESCKLLAPNEVESIDPYLTQFCQDNSELDESGIRVWKNDAVAIWRPGGCINTQTFLPLFYEYLRKSMGTYINANGITKDCFKLKFDRNVVGVEYDVQDRVEGLRFFNPEKAKTNNQHPYQHSDYIFCPGEKVGTLRNLGFQEPEYAIFAGPALKLTVDLPTDQIEKYKSLNHCMEVHQEGVVLAWQVWYESGTVKIAVGGTKAFYAGERPTIYDAFAKLMGLLQLRSINDVLPDLVSLALKSETRGKTLNQSDMDKLEGAGIVKRWVGARAVAYDGFPTIGKIYTADSKEVTNARTTTGLGSGGVSFGPAAVWASRKDEESELINSVQDCGDSARTMGP